MNDASTASRRRSVTSVDLGPLKPHVDALSAAAGVGPSTWLRELVRLAVENGGATFAAVASHSVAPSDAAPFPQDRPQSVYRAWLDADLTAELDAIVRAGGFRSRSAALRGMLKKVGLSGSDASTADAVRALGVSNHQLVAVGRNVNQIAKALHARQGRITAAERIELEEVTQAIHQHLDVASRLVSELRPMLRTEREEART